MKRVIVEYKKLNQEILGLLVAKFPLGYDDTDIVSFRNADYELIEAVEVKTEDTIYLVKISKRLADTMEKFHVNDNEDIEETEAEKDEDDEILSANNMEDEVDENDFDEDEVDKEP